MTSEDPAERGGGEKLLREGEGKRLVVRNRKRLKAGHLETRQGHDHGLVFIVNLTEFRIIMKAMPLKMVAVQTDAMTVSW